MRQTRIRCSALLRHRWAALVSNLATRGAVEPHGVETHDNTPEIQLQMACLDTFGPSLLASTVKLCIARYTIDSSLELYLHGAH